MKFFLFACLFSLMSCSLSAQNSFSRPLGVADFYSFTKQGSTPCEGRLAGEGKHVVVSGYLHKINVFPAENRFILFEDEGMTKSIEIRVVKSQNKIFEKLSRNFASHSSGEFVQVRLKGRIQGIPLPLNKSCLRGAFLTLKNASNLKIESRKQKPPGI